MERVVRCVAKYCLHDKRELSTNKAVGDGTSYYHPDCFKLQENTRKICKLWGEKISSAYVKKDLINVINNIVINKKVSSDKLLYGVKYFIRNGLGLRYPAGLYYVVQNREVDEAYKSYQQSKVLKMKVYIPPDDDPLKAPYTYKPAKEKGIGDIFDS